MNPDRYAQIKKLFFAAMELPESARDQFLNDQCGDDAQLRQEVASLLDHESSQTIIASDSKTSHTPVDTRSNSARVTLRERARKLHSKPRVPWLGSKGHLAFGSAIVLVLLVLFGFWQRQAVNASIKQSLHERINALLDGHVQSFEHWANFQRRTVEYWARDRDFQRCVNRLVNLVDSNTDQFMEDLRNAPEQAEIRHELRSAIGESIQYVVLDIKQRVIADGATTGLGLGELASDTATSKLAPVFRGETVMFMDNIQDIVHEQYPVRQDIEDVFVATPIRDASQQIVAVIALFHVDTALMQNTMLSISQITDTSETYAFNHSGLMLSESRFTDELRRVGILKPDQSSSLNVYLRDPGVDLTQGDVSEKPLDTRPLTRMARYATVGHNSSDIEGYRNYLGTNVVGAWRWLPEYDLGFALEMSHEEAYQPLRSVENQFVLSFLLLTASVIVMLGSAVWISKLRRQAGIGQMGQYTLEKLIGEGGMGQVYKAKHAMLKRPCALKLLKPDQSNPKNLAWFEREVQAASELSHPNTIQIYDYGTTPVGNFFYVMEFLHGIDLEQLVVSDGPIPWPRVVYILKQICFSLREAHESGLVHRDIKPQNIVICQLGCEFDFVKVLDFGLVKKIDHNAMTHAKTRTLAGTPLYMAPERWRNTGEQDPRSDIYSLGAVAYRLLSGREIYSADSTGELVEQIMTTDVTPLSSLDCPEIPPALQRLVMSCLARDMGLRPNSIHEVLEKLNLLRDDTTWDQTQARQWWTEWESYSQAAANKRSD